MTLATVIRMPRSQAHSKAAGIEAATEDVDGALTEEACAMYGAALSTLRQIDALLIKVMIAEQSHKRVALGEGLEFMRAQVGLRVEHIYRIACESPRSRFLTVIDAQAALRAESVLFLWPKSQ